MNRRQFLGALLAAPIAAVGLKRSSPAFVAPEAPSWPRQVTDNFFRNMPFHTYLIKKEAQWPNKALPPS